MDLKKAQDLAEQEILNYTSASEWEQVAEMQWTTAEIQDIIAKALVKNIGVIPCCKSDSEQLPSKEKLNFQDWLKLRKIERISDDCFKWEGSKYTYYYVNDRYKQYRKN